MDRLPPSRCGEGYLLTTPAAGCVRAGADARITTERRGSQVEQFGGIKDAPVRITYRHVALDGSQKIGQALEASGATAVPNCDRATIPAVGPPHQEA